MILLGYPADERAKVQRDGLLRQKSDSGFASVPPPSNLSATMAMVVPKRLLHGCGTLPRDGTSTDPYMSQRLLFQKGLSTKSECFPYNKPRYPPNCPLMAKPQQLRLNVPHSASSLPLRQRLRTSRAHQHLNDLVVRRAPLFRGRNRHS